MIKQYKRIPKWIRFALYWMTIPVWGSVLAVILVVALSAIYSYDLAIKSWRDFQ